MFNRRKGWKLWVGAGLVFVAGFLPWLGTVWPAWSSKTIPEWAEEQGYPMTPVVIAWIVLCCAAIGVGFVLWFIFSPVESDEKSPLSLCPIGETPFRHGMEFGSIRVKNESPNRSAKEFKAELVKVCEPEKWKDIDTPLTLTTTPEDTVSVNPSGTVIVDILGLWQQTNNFDRTQSLRLQTTLPTKQPTNVLSYPGPDVKVDEPFSIIVKLTAQDFMPAVYKLTCKLSIVPRGPYFKLGFDYTAKAISPNKY